MIIYFSGTGNSLYIAKKLAEKLDDKIIHINEAAKLGEIKDNQVGIVFPIYFSGAPRYFNNLLEKISFKKDTYFYAVATSGSEGHNGLIFMKEHLDKMGYKLSYGCEIGMTDNSGSSLMKTKGTPPENLKYQHDKVDETSRAVLAGADNSNTFKKHPLHTITYKGETSGLGRKIFTPKVNKTNCTKCGVCAKICPSQNITIDEDGATIHDKCTECVGCVHNCPEATIKLFKMNIPKANQFRHSEIKLQELFLN